MSKELEALESIQFGCCKSEDRTLYLDEFDIIETALKDKEQTDILLEQFGLNTIQNFIDNLKIVAREQKKLKAFEIIKEKNVNIRGIKETKNFHEYNVKFPATLNEFLEEQEYDLLKEVLTNV